MWPRGIRIRRNAVAAALTLVALAACSEAPPTQSLTRVTPRPVRDAASEPSNGAPAHFDWLLDGVPCAGWQPFWSMTTMADRDGDGVKAEWAQHCVDGRVRTAFRPNRTWDWADCDDNDPTRSLGVWRDADADGFAAQPTWEACVDEVPPGFTHAPVSMGVWDCDDIDPGLQERLYVDADSDGYGDKSATRCAPFVPYSQPSPPGLTRDATDCDDADPRRHPGAFEQWNDGFDANCDGRDQPLECVSTSPWCGCELLSTPPPAVDPSCASADLFVVAKAGCTSCSGYSVVVIGNRGTTPANGGFDLVISTQTGYEQRLSVPLDLAPGEKTLPIALSWAPRQVRIESSSSECDKTNNIEALESHNVPCE